MRTSYRYHPLDIDLLKEFELIGADSKNDNVIVNSAQWVPDGVDENRSGDIKAEIKEDEDLLEPEPRARCNTWPRLQFAAAAGATANAVANGGSPVMQVCM